MNIGEPEELENAGAATDDKNSNDEKWRMKVRKRKERAFYKYMKYSYEQKLLLLQANGEKLKR